MKSVPILETERLLIRSWQASDRIAFAALNADPRVTAYLPKTLTTAESDAMADRITANLTAHGYGLFALELKENRRFIGYTGLANVTFVVPFAPAVEIGWRLSYLDWGQGYATEAARRVARFAFEDLQLDELVSFTVPANAASRRVMEKLGMRRDPDGDFLHPNLPDGHKLRPHVLYRLKR